MAQWYKGTKVQRNKGTKAQWYKGTKEQRNKGRRVHSTRLENERNFLLYDLQYVINIHDYS